MEQDIRQLTDLASASAITSHECSLRSHLHNAGGACELQELRKGIEASCLCGHACIKTPFWDLAKLCKTHKAGQAKARWWQEILMKVRWKYIPYPAVKCSDACISLYFSPLHETNQAIKTLASLRDLHWFAKFRKWSVDPHRSSFSMAQLDPILHEVHHCAFEAARCGLHCSG